MFSVHSKNILGKEILKLGKYLSGVPEKAVSKAVWRYVKSKSNK